MVGSPPIDQGFADQIGADGYGRGWGRDHCVGQITAVRIVALYEQEVHMRITMKYGKTGLDIDFPEDWNIVRIEKKNHAAA